MKRFASLLIVPLAALVACGGATTNLGNDATNDGGASPNPTSNGAGSGSTTNPDDGSANDAGSASLCGRITASAPPSFLPCNGGEYCQQNVGKCHSGGSCKPITATWDGQCSALVPSCGCDGKEYCSAEHAQVNGTTIAFTGPCSFDCGDTPGPIGTVPACNGLNQYCEHGSGGAPPPDGGKPFEQWTCRPFPAKCLSADDLSCECLKAQGITVGACAVKNGHVRVEEFLP